MSKLSDKQRAWLKKLGAVVNSGDGGGAEVAAPEKLNIITVIPVVVDALKIKCTCKVLNRSQQKLLLNKIKLDHPTGNGFEKAPQDEIAPGGSDEFVVVNKAPFHLGVLGELEYEVEGENP